MKSVVMVFAAVSLCCSCVPRSKAPALDKSKNKSVESVAPITTDEQAKVRALEFLKDQKHDWGEPVAVFRTVSNWYRVEFNKAQGRERVVLVNPVNGHAEFPLRR